MKQIAVLTSGGDAPGMNAAIRAVTRGALDQGMTVYGVREGWQGLVEGQFQRLNARDVGGIIQVGGTFLVQRISDGLLHAQPAWGSRGRHPVHHRQRSVRD